MNTPGFEPLFQRFSLEVGEQREEELVLSRIPASRQPRTGAESAATGTAPATAGRLPESIGGAVGQEPPSEPSSERIAELVERAAALQQQLQRVLDELQTVLDDPGQPSGRPDDPVRIGNGVPPPAKIHDVPPVYPPAAREAGSCCRLPERGTRRPPRRARLAQLREPGRRMASPDEPRALAGAKL